MQGESRLRRGLLAGEVALALAVLAAAGVAMESLERLRRVDVGFEPDGLLALRLELPAGTGGGARRVAALEELRRDVATLPGVDRVALADTRLPLEGGQGTFEFHVGGQEREPRSEIRSLAGIVSGGYFETLGIALRAGRTFAVAETWEAAHPVVVNQGMVDRLWPGEDGLGRELVFSNGEVGTVVGVVADVRQTSVRQDSGNEVYVPWGVRASRQQTLVLRVAGRPRSHERSIRREIASRLPGTAVVSVASGEELVAGSLAKDRGFASLMSVFGTLCLLLGTAGVFAVASAHVGQRRREIGVRMALGASPRRALGEVLVAALRPVGVGLVAGSGLAMALGRLWESRLYDTSSWDPPTLIAALAILGGAALLASLMAACRVTRIDPSVALRCD